MVSKGKRAQRLAVGLLLWVSSAGLGAQEAPLPQAADHLDRVSRDRLFAIAPDLRARTRGMARTRGLTRLRGVSDPELVAMNAYYGNALEVQNLIHRKTDVDSGYVPTCGLKGNALFTAVIRDHRTIVKLLLGAGASTDFTLHNGYTDFRWGWLARTPVEVAREMGNEEMVHILENRISIKSPVRRVDGLERYFGFEAYPTAKPSVPGGRVYDFRTGQYRHTSVCRAPYRHNTKTLVYGVVLPDPATGRMACDIRDSLARVARPNDNFEVLVQRIPLGPKQEIVWQQMYGSYSYDPTFRVGSGSLLARYSVHEGFTLTGVDRLWYRFAEKTPAEARTQGYAHEVLTIVEY